MMRIKLRAYAGLRRYLSPELSVGQSVPLEMPPGSTVGDALDRVGIPHGETKNCFVNGIQRGLDHQMAEGDELAIFPPVGGGVPA